MIKQAHCRTCHAQLFEALTERGEKIMMDWKPTTEPATEAGFYILIQGATDMPTVRKIQLTDEWPVRNINRWTAHTDTCKGHHR